MNQHDWCSAHWESFPGEHGAWNAQVHYCKKHEGDGHPEHECICGEKPGIDVDVYFD